MNQLINNQSLTMSSQEIASVVNLRHDNVKRTMENLLQKSLITFTQSEEKGNGRPAVVYHVNKRDSYVCVAQLSPEFTVVLVDRWQELEGQQVLALPTNKELAMMVIKAEDEKEAAEREVNRLQGVCNTIVAQFTDGITAPKFCHQLNGVNVQAVNKTLVKNGVLLKTGMGLEPASYHRDNNFKVSYKTIVVNDCNKNVATTTLTRKGAVWLYKAYLSGKLPMKQNWDGINSHVVFESESSVPALPNSNATKLIN